MSERTKAEKWLYAIKAKTAGLFLEQSIRRAVERASDDYPHLTFALTSGGGIIGTRHVFHDRSYCDHMFSEAGTGKVTFGEMTEGMLGKAFNGRKIDSVT